MAYSAVLSDSQQLAIANLGGQTRISLTSSSPGQQQSQSSSFSTGEWSKAPKLYEIGNGFVLEIDTKQKQHYILIQQNSLTTIEVPANLDSYPQVNLTTVTDPSPESTSPMKPMQPMKMGNMSMDINSMSMQMGNMSMGSQNRQKQNIAQFCSQCGVEAKPGARFCSSCGHELSQ